MVKKIIIGAIIALGLAGLSFVAFSKKEDDENSNNNNDSGSGGSGGSGNQSLDEFLQITSGGDNNFVAASTPKYKITVKQKPEATAGTSIIADCPGAMVSWAPHLLLSPALRCRRTKIKVGDVIRVHKKEGTRVVIDKHAVVMQLPYTSTVMVNRQLWGGTNLEIKPDARIIPPWIIHPQRLYDARIPSVFVEHVGNVKDISKVTTQWGSYTSDPLMSSRTFAPDKVEDWYKDAFKI